MKNNVFLFCVKNYGVFFVVFFFADKMHFKSPKLDGFKIAVAKDGDTRDGILWRHSPSCIAGTPTRILLREDLCPKDNFFLFEKFLNDAA